MSRNKEDPVAQQNMLDLVGDLSAMMLKSEERPKAATASSVQSSGRDTECPQYSPQYTYRYRIVQGALLLFQSRNHEKSKAQYKLSNSWLF